MYSHPFFNEESYQSPDTKYEISLSKRTGWEFLLQMSGDDPNKWRLNQSTETDMIMLLFSAESAKKDGTPYSVNISVGGGMIRPGYIQDTNWDTTDNVKDYRYKTSPGNIASYSISLVWKFADITNELPVYLSIKYDYLFISANYNDAITATNISDPNDIKVITSPIEDQIYNLGIGGGEVGIKSAISLAKDVLLETSIGYSPAARAKYEGVRYNTDPTGRRNYIVANGIIFNYEFGLNINIIKSLFIEAGYRYNSFLSRKISTYAWLDSADSLDTHLKDIYFSCAIIF